MPVTIYSWWLPRIRVSLPLEDKRMRSALSLCLLILSPSWLPADPPDSGIILERYQHKRPDARQLAMYRLDWANSIETALDRSRVEGRPVMLIVIHARYGDITSGHC